MYRIEFIIHTQIDLFLNLGLGPDPDPITNETKISKVINSF